MNFECSIGLLKWDTSKTLTQWPSQFEAWIAKKSKVHDSQFALTFDVEEETQSREKREQQ